MAIKRLKFNKELCIGCQLCMEACSAMHEGVYSTELARLEIESFYDKGEDVKIDTHICVLCGRCSKECPEKAITVSERLELNKALCTGCGICAQKCPTKCIKMRDEKPVLCDTCNGEPWCATVCPHGALSFA